MSNLHEPIVINIIGHTTGAIIFGIFLFLFLRDRGSALGRGSWLSAAAAALAFCWNAGSLTALLAIRNASPASSSIVAVTFCCLSLLPAVLLHLSMDGQMPVLTAIGYSLGFVAAVMHCVAAISGADPYRSNALLLTTVGFVALTAISVARVAKVEPQRGRTSRVIASMCLLLFSMSLIHFGSGHPLHAWSTEAALHHGGIPLALFILMQDYRFVLLDAFIRFLVNALLAAAVTIAGLEAAEHLKLVGPVQMPNQAVLVLGVGVLLILFAFLRGVIQHWLTEAVFRRPNLEDFLRRIRARTDWGSEGEFVSWSASQMAAFMKAEQWSVTQGGESLDLFFPTPVSEVEGFRTREEYRWAELLVPLRFSFGEVRHVLLGRRRGGRRYLSEDFRVLNRLATTISEQVEHHRDAEMQKLVIQAELQALQSQINPHFLFNALNTLFGIIPREASGARRTVLNLADIFRYSLQTPDHLITMSEELDIVRAYLEIEKLRMGSRLQVEIDVDEPAKEIKIPVLSIQPLVENAVKHGVSASDQPGFVRISAKQTDAGIEVAVEDSGSGAPAPASKPGMGLGLANVSKRLQLCYGTQSGIQFRLGPPVTKVGFSIPAVSHPVAT